jgi:hypothetical protein
VRDEADAVQGAVSTTCIGIRIGVGIGIFIGSHKPTRNRRTHRRWRTPARRRRDHRRGPRVALLLLRDVPGATSSSEHVSQTQARGGGGRRVGRWGQCSAPPVTPSWCASALHDHIVRIRGRGLCVCVGVGMGRGRGELAGDFDVGLGRVAGTAVAEEGAEDCCAQRRRVVPCLHTHKRPVQAVGRHVTSHASQRQGTDASRYGEYSRYGL